MSFTKNSWFISFAASLVVTSIIFMALALFSNYYKAQSVKADMVEGAGSGASTSMSSTSAALALAGVVSSTGTQAQNIPVWLTIPTIGVDAQVDMVGLTADGAMGAPIDPDHVGWLSSSASPGAAGTAVIDGHRGWIEKMAVVFDRLHELHIGDNIYVKDASSTITTFVVREMRSYNTSEDVSAVFGKGGGAISGAHLNLITCDGDWDATSKTYTRRLVVFADKVGK
jgi:LPXTG-site transpeptidase (sortase) family protein